MSSLVFCTVFQGLKHLHNNDMVHMDIKPANVFIGLDGLCKIGDFGLVLELSKVGYSEASYNAQCTVMGQTDPTMP